MPSATIKLFLVHGDAKRLRTAELSNWTGKAVAGPRSELDGVLAREETAKSGVYFLSGIDSESGKSAVYVPIYPRGTEKVDRRWDIGRRERTFKVHPRRRV
jgi:hypothetical protein